jgi:hypothetical protein
MLYRGLNRFISVDSRRSASFSDGVRTVSISTTFKRRYGIWTRSSDDPGAKYCLNRFFRFFAFPMYRTTPRSSFIRYTPGFSG